VYNGIGAVLTVLLARSIVVTSNCRLGHSNDGAGRFPITFRLEERKEGFPLRDIVGVPKDFHTGVKMPAHCMVASAYINEYRLNLAEEVERASFLRQSNDKVFVHLGEVDTFAKHSVVEESTSGIDVKQFPCSEQDRLRYARVLENICKP